MRGGAIAAGTPCPAFDCGAQVTRRGYCEKHYKRLLRHGEVRRTYSDGREAFFWTRVDQSGGPDACWPWQGKIDQRGYGQIKIAFKDYGAHRVALEYHLGHPLAVGMETCHNCDNPPCCNPRHLREDTHTENMRDVQRRERRENSGNTESRE